MEEKGGMIWILTRTTLHYASWFRDSKTQTKKVQATCPLTCTYSSLHPKAYKTAAGIC